MNWNWGKGIILSFIIFFSAIGAIVVYFFNQKVDMVTDNYYQKELVYQEQINRINRTNQLDEQVGINLNGKQIEIKFPRGTEGLSGRIFFYRPSDERMDFSRDASPDSSGTQYISTDGIMPGYWKIRLEFRMNGEDYFYEKSVMI